MTHGLEVRGVELRPQFIDSEAGPLFATLYSPSPNPAAYDMQVAGQSASETVVLLLPPFAEELNKSRRQINLQARRWCKAGVSVAVVDLFGTGDSAGEFVAADVNAWQDSIRTAINWLQNLGYKHLVPWAIRYGATLLETACAQTMLPVSSLQVWQPMTNGKQTLMQLLRVEAMAGIDGDGPKTTTTELLSHLADGQIIEAGGYQISPSLAAQMQLQDLATFAPKLNTRVELFHVGASVTAAVPVGVNKLQQRWHDNGANVNLNVVSGNQFWTTVEVSVNDELIKQSYTRMIAGAHDE